MFKNKNNFSNNLCGNTIKEVRKTKFPGLSQRGLADKLQLTGIDFDKMPSNELKADSVLLQISNYLPSHKF